MKPIKTGGVRPALMTDPTTLNWISERAPLSTSLQTPLNACVWHSFIHSFTYAYSFILASLNFNNDILAIRIYQFGCTDLPYIPRYSGIFVSSLCWTRTAPLATSFISSYRICKFNLSTRVSLATKIHSCCLLTNSSLHRSLIHPFSIKLLSCAEWWQLLLR